MPRVNRTRFAILGLLSLSPMSGYDIRRFGERTLGHCWSESFGPIYRALRELVAAGLVARVAGAGGGRPDRRLYRLTPEGAAELKLWLQRPAEPQVPRNELLLKLFLGPQLPPGARLEHVRRERRRRREALRRLEDAEAEMQRLHAGSPYLPYWLLGVRAERRAIEAGLAWCDEAAEELARLDG